MTNVMTTEHPEWDTFCALLSGPEACDFHQDEKGKWAWTCKAGRDKTFARTILMEWWNDIDVGASLAYFDRHGGHCDCEILFNVDREH